MTHRIWCVRLLFQPLFKPQIRKKCWQTCRLKFSRKFSRTQDIRKCRICAWWVEWYHGIFLIFLSNINYFIYWNFFLMMKKSPWKIQLDPFGKLDHNYINANLHRNKLARLTKFSHSMHNRDILYGALFSHRFQRKWIKYVKRF